ncbi:hypothetical protein CSB69_1951 [Morganella morganii]|nr:hypothetical protein CSB69_1951 [Morganella morganii]
MHDSVPSRKLYHLYSQPESQNYNLLKKLKNISDGDQFFLAAINVF